MKSLAALFAVANIAAPYATGSAPEIPWARLIIAFIFCMIVALGAIGFIRKRNNMPVTPDDALRLFKIVGKQEASPADRLQIVQRLSVTPAGQLVDLKRGQQHYILYLTSTGVTEIDRFIDDESNEAIGGDQQ